MGILEEHIVRHCRNCGEPLSSDALYCPKCSQKYTDGRITLRQLLHDFLESFLNFDAKIFRTLRDLFIPGKLTIEYFKGKHVSYLTPIRIFLLLALLHFGIIGYFGFDAINFNFKIEQDKLEEAVHQAAFLEQLDSAEQKVLTQYFNNSPVVARAMDSLRHQFKEADLDTFEFGYFDFQRDFTIKPTNLKIAERDVYEPIDTLIQKYNITGFFEKLQVRQSLRLFRDTSSFSGFLLGKLIWMVLLMMPALALVLKLLYIRRHKYFVEHLVFSFHYHAFAFLLIGIAILLHHSGWFDAFSNSDDDPFIIVIGFIIVVIYLFIAMRRVYQQGFWKTFVKFNLLNFSYFFIFILSFIFTAIISVLIF